MHSPGYYKFFFWLTAVVSLLIQSCSPGSQSPSFQQVSSLPDANFCRVAILPFINDTDFKQGSVIIRRIFATEMQRAGFIVAQEGDVSTILRQLKIIPSQELSLDEIRVLAGRLNVEALITGKIFELREDVRQDRTEPVIALNIQFIGADTGRMLWTTYHSRTGEDYRTVLHFGLVNTLFRLGKVMSAEIIKRWFDEGLKSCQN